MSQVLMIFSKRIIRRAGGLLLDRSFVFYKSWCETQRIRRELIKARIPFQMSSTEKGQIEFVLPDLPHRVYNQVRQIFGGYGLTGICKSEENSHD